jgi:ATP-dependent protease ClpP protease subunit
VATMLYLDSENHKDMQLYINCSGGEVTINLPTTLIALVQ